MSNTRIGVTQERGNGKKDLGDGQNGAPVVLECIQADISTTIDVAMIDSC